MDPLIFVAFKIQYGILQKKIQYGRFYI